jgi:hypothetical protein
MEEIFLKCTLENDIYNCVVLNQGEEISLKTIKNSEEPKEILHFNVSNGEYIAHFLFKNDEELKTVYNEEYDDLNGNFSVEDGDIYDIDGNVYILNEDTNVFEGIDYDLTYYGLNFFEVKDKANDKTYGVQFTPNVSINNIINDIYPRRLYQLNNDSQFWWTGKGVNLLNNFFVNTDNSVIPNEEDEVTSDELTFLFNFDGVEDLLKSYFYTDEVNVEMLIVWLLNNTYITNFDVVITRNGLQGIQKIGEEEELNFNEIPDDLNENEVTEYDLYTTTASLIIDDKNLIKSNKILTNYMYSEYSLLFLTLFMGLASGIITNKNEANTTIEYTNSKIVLKQGELTISFDIEDGEIVNTDEKYLMYSNNYFYLNYYGEELHFLAQY